MFSQDYIKHFRENVKLAYPIVLGQLSHILISVADNVMVGNYSSDALAASSLAHGVYISIMVFGIGFTLGITPLAANALGANKPDECRKLLKHGLLMYPIVGAILSLIGLYLSYHLSWFNDKFIIIELAQPYLRILALTLVPIMIFQCFRQFVEGLSMTKEPMYVNIGGLVLNVGLNYLLIFGKLGFPEMGLEGAGYATLITRIVMAMVLIILFMMREKSRFYIFSSAHHFEMPLMRRLRKLGLPIGMQMFFEAGAFAFATFLVGKVGVNELAAHQIALSIGSITFLITTGLSAAASIRTASELGRQDEYNLKLAGKTTILMGVLFMGCCGVLIYLMRYLIPTWYVSDIQVHEITSELLVLVALFQVSDGVQVVSIGALRGIEDVRIPTLISLIAYWFVGIPLGYVLCFQMNWGIEGVWIGLLAGLTAAAIMLAIRFLVVSNKIFHSKFDFMKYFSS